MQIISNLSLWWLLPILICSIALALFLYQKKRSTWNDELCNKKRLTLVILRSTSLFLIGLSLLGILIQYKSSRVQKPILVIAVDDSSSMLNYSDSSKMVNDFTAWTKNVDKRLSDKYTIHYLSAAHKPEEITFPVQYKRDKTNLYAGLEGIKKRFFGQNLAALVLFSDGNITEGNLPQYAVQDLLETSIYAIGVGDSTFKPDQAIKHVAANDMALLGNTFLVNVDVAAFGFAGQTSAVSISHAGKVVANNTVSYSGSREDVQSLSFEIAADKVGVQAFTIRVEEKKGEHTFTNNVRTFYVNIIDARNKILLLADGPHPDLKALERVFERDENSKVESHLLSEWNKDLKDVTLLVVHSPGAISNMEMAKFIGQSNVSKLYILGTTADEKFFKAFNGNISISPAKQFDDVTGALNIEFTPFQFESNWEQALKNWAPLKVRFGSVNVPNGAHTLLYQKVGPVVKKDPLIYFMDQTTSGGRLKIGVITGEGIWRWRMADFAMNQSFEVFDGLFGKIGQYLSVKQNTDQFRVQAPKQVTVNKEAIFTANVYNDSYEPTTSSKVFFKLSKENELKKSLEFSVRDSSYHLNLGKLEAGIYNWQANTQYGGKNLTKTGQLVVEENHVEQMDARANHQVLVQLANIGAGKFVQLAQADGLIDELLNRKDLTSKAYENIQLKDFIAFYWFFIAIVCVLCLEWFLRRYWGNY